MSRQKQKEAIRKNDRKVAGENALREVSLVFPFSSAGMYDWEWLQSQLADWKGDAVSRSGSTLKDQSLLFSWVGVSHTKKGKVNNERF